MLNILWLVPILPLAGFVILALTGKRISHKAVSIIGTGSILSSFIITVIICAAFISSPPQGNAYRQTAGIWFDVANYRIEFGLYLDALSVVMISVVTFVGLLIHFYSTEFMAEDEGYSRFFAYMNLFVASMLILVLADNLLFLYLGWEGVGLCSYLLIGFWYKEKENCNAAIKAFIVTRIGDALMAIALFMLLIKFGTLSIQPILEEISGFEKGSAFCTAAALLLLGGAVGKSAQLPLQVWLPDAMAGPTPVSALIHAATMVTAGVYLIARTHTIFEMSPQVMYIVAIIGAATLLLAGLSAFVQTDIKRILAYSTMSQIGYMFLALGVGAWSAGIYHFITHAFFKSSLFLCAGVLITSLNGEHNIFKMGGLRKIFPYTFAAFFLASLSLAAMPPFTATFDSKEVILNSVLSSPYGSKSLWAAGVIGAFISSAYIFRLIFVVFFGETKARPEKKVSSMMVLPLIILSLIAALSGLPELLSSLFGIKSFYNFLYSSLPQENIRTSREWLTHVLYVSSALIGAITAYIIYCRENKTIEAFSKSIIGINLHSFLKKGWAFDWFYDKVIVRPIVFAARINSKDFIDQIYKGFTNLIEFANRILSTMVTGRLRWYVTCLVIGVIIITGVIIFL